MNVAPALPAVACVSCDLEPHGGKPGGEFPQVATAVRLGLPITWGLSPECCPLTEVGSPSRTLPQVGAWAVVADPAWLARSAWSLVGRRTDPRSKCLTHWPATLITNTTLTVADCDAALAAGFQGISSPALGPECTQRSGCPWATKHPGSQPFALRFGLWHLPITDCWQVGGGRWSLYKAHAQVDRAFRALARRGGYAHFRLEASPVWHDNSCAAWLGLVAESSQRHGVPVRSLAAVTEWLLARGRAQPSRSALVAA